MRTRAVSDPGRAAPVVPAVRTTAEDHGLQRTIGNQAVLRRRSLSKTRGSSDQAGPMSEEDSAALRARGNAFMTRFKDELVEIAHDRPDGRKNLPAIREALRGMGAAAEATGDLRFEQLLALTESAVASIFGAPPLPIERTLEPRLHQQVRMYSKMEKHYARMDAHGSARARLAREAQGSQPWRKLGTKLGQSWAGVKWGLSRDKTLEYQQELTASGGVSQGFLVELTLRRARHAIQSSEPGRRAVALGDALAGECSAQGAFFTVFTLLVQDHVNATIIDHYQDLSGLDWWRGREH